ncbi:MAG TPA: hypothetical protein VIM11_20615 [Tepidisphaeraceae bacterium]|jgi:hypothetical protein
MILAGIDEAGYGPLLGPLVVGCCAFRINGDLGDGEVPCVWTRLRKYVSRNRVKTGRKIHVNDSKAVYSSSVGLKELERSVLAISSAAGGWDDTLDQAMDRLAPGAARESREYSWYQPADEEAFPIEQDAMPVRIFGNALRQEMNRTSTHCVHLCAQLVFERRFNRMLNATRNKASTLFSIAAMHLDYLLKTHGHEGLVIICDRQGGREHYGQLLRMMFEDWSLEIDCEKDGNSEYRLLRDGHVVRIVFREKAEANCLSVAVASMLSKYLREAMMRRFNAYWQRELPGVAPTAGYYGDGTRFLSDIAQRRKELGIGDEELVRCK